MNGKKQIAAQDEVVAFEAALKKNRKNQAFNLIVSIAGEIISLFSRSFSDGIDPREYRPGGLSGARRKNGERGPVGAWLDRGSTIDGDRPGNFPEGSSPPEKLYRGSRVSASPGASFPDKLEN
ncbi:hypothetical protein KM043_007461 [Ampulex compressa]|nr:hypothetical protein KM043_007461 [Ampulex compressa]